MYFLWWCHQESNRGHKDFQSFALPTELWHHCFSFAVAKVGIFFESTNFLQIFCQILFGFKKMIYLCTRKTETECSAVGSALRSGRRGRAFESPHSDKQGLTFNKLSLFCSVFVPLNHENNKNKGVVFAVCIFIRIFASNAAGSVRNGF